MQSFKFRLETLLKFRKMQQEQAQITFWQATNQFRIETEKLTKLQGKLLENINLLRTFQQRVLSVETLKSFRYYFDKMKEEIHKQEESVRCSDEHRQKCLSVLEDSMKNCKVVEKFKEKKFQNYQVELIKEEQKMLDEIGLQLYVREK